MKMRVCAAHVLPTSATLSVRLNAAEAKMAPYSRFQPYHCVRSGGDEWTLSVDVHCVGLVCSDNGGFVLI